MKSGKCCWLCGRNGSTDPLERHHIFGGALRNKSEQYGLVVFLCGERCHRNGRKAAHRCGETMQQLHEYGQLKAKQEQGWSREEFIRQFGKSFTDKLPEVSGSGYFSIDESEEYI